MDRDSTTVDPTAPDRTDWHSDLDERADTVTTLISTDPESLTDDDVARLVDELTTGTALWDTAVADYLADVATERPTLLVDHVGTIVGTATLHDELLAPVADCLLAVSDHDPTAIAPHVEQFIQLPAIDQWTPTHTALSRVLAVIPADYPSDPVGELLQRLCTDPLRFEAGMRFLTLVAHERPELFEHHAPIVADCLGMADKPTMRRHAQHAVAIASAGLDTLSSPLPYQVSKEARKSQHRTRTARALETTMWLLVDHQSETASNAILSASNRWLEGHGAAPAGPHAVGCLALVASEHPEAIPDEHVPAVIDTLELAAERIPHVDAADRGPTEWIGIRTHPEGPPTLDRVESALATLREAAPPAAD